MSEELVVIQKNVCMAMKCKESIPDLRLFCKEHWFGIPLSLKLVLFDTAFGLNQEEFILASREAIDILYDKERQL